MKNADLLAKRPPDNQHRFDQLSKIREVFDKLLDARLKLQRSPHAHLEAEVTQSLTQLVIDRDGVAASNSRLTAPRRSNLLAYR